jgi:hypothetical protein
MSMGWTVGTGPAASVVDPAPAAWANGAEGLVTDVTSPSVTSIVTRI